jgi:hypothetical protein
VRPINQALLLCLDVPGTQALTQACQRLWAGCAVPLHLGFPAGREELRPAVARAGAALTAAGCRVTTLEPLPALSPAAVAELQEQYGLVAVALERDLRKDHAVLEWLPQVKAPLMLVLR